MTVYQILNWNDHFENSRSRSVEICSFVAMPNKQHGMGLQRILSAPDGAAMFGIWCLILQSCSRQPSNQYQVRNGWLTDDGLPQGRPWAPDDLSFVWRQPEELIARALKLFCDAKIGWIRCYEETPPSTAETPSSDVEGKEQKEQKGRKECAGATPPPPGDLSEASKAMRMEFMKLGAVMADRDGSDLWPAWQAVCRGHKIEWIRKMFRDRPTPRWPSKMEKKLEYYSGEYPGWLEEFNRRKETK